MGICGLRPSAIRTALAANFALLALLSFATQIARADSAAFDLAGPRIQMTVTRAGKTLPISDKNLALLEYLDQKRLALDLLSDAARQNDPEKLEWGRQVSYRNKAKAEQIKGLIRQVY